MARVVPSLALVAYADAWLSAAKVIVFGDALSTLPEQLIERGARLVYVYDSDPARVAEATQRSSSANVSFAPLEQAGSLARDGAFDLGIIEDIGGGGPPAARLLESLARALGRRGVALIASRNPDVQQRLIETQGSDTPPLGYYPLHELVRSHFSDVRMLGQAPFVGYAIIDFGAETEDEINIDTALVPGGAEQPEWFVALASQHELHAEGFSVIQLPFTGMGQRGPRHVELERARASEKRALARVAKLEQEQVEASAASQAAQVSQAAPANPAAAQANPAAAQANPVAAQANPAAQANQAEVERLRRELAEREKWLTGLEARASTADQRADDMQVELERLREENTARQQELERARGSAGEGPRLKRLEEDKNVLRQELLALRKQLDEQRRASEEQRRLHEEQRRASDEQRRASDEQRRAQDDGKRQQDESRRQLEDSRRQLEELRKQHEDGKRQQEEGRLQLEELRRQHAEARRQSDEARVRQDEARRQLDEQRKQHEELKRRHDDELARQAKSNAELDSLRKALADARQKLDERSERVATLEQQLSEGGGEPAQEVALLEEQLVERGREVARLEQAIAETERFGKQLIVQLEALKQDPGDAGVARLEKLTQRNAELEANLEALRWTVAQLQATSADSPRSSDADGNVQRQAVLLEQARPVTG